MIYIGVFGYIFLRARASSTPAKVVLMLAFMPAHYITSLWRDWLQTNSSACRASSNLKPQHPEAFQKKRQTSDLIITTTATTTIILILITS